MKTLILHLLDELGIDTFELLEKHRASVEMFFVKKKLDLRRSKAVTEYELTVYRDFEENGSKFRGSSKVLLFPGMDADIIERTLKDAFAAATHVKNPYFPLYAGKEEEKTSQPTKLAELTAAEGALHMAEALYKADVQEGAFLNSAEVFVNRETVSVTNSQGVAVSYVRMECTGEFVVQAKEPQDVEQYFSFAYGDLEEEALTRKAEAALNTVRDRAHAVEAPDAGTYDIVLSGENLAILLELYTERSHAALIYPKYSDWQPGTAVQGDCVTGEKLNLALLSDTPYSTEGIPMTERVLLREGVLQCIHGSNRFCCYLGVEPTGEYTRARLDNGSVPFEDMRKDCLYPVSFSDFQMDALTGRFGGEIRLAYLYDGEKVKLYTGGSVNGSLFEKQGQLRFSLERYKDASYEGPLAVRIPGVEVSGK